MSFCSQCGTPLAGDARFCHRCGAATVPAYAPPSAPASYGYAPQSHQQQPQQQQQQYGYPQPPPGYPGPRPPEPLAAPPSYPASHPPSNIGPPPSSYPGANPTTFPPPPPAASTVPAQGEKLATESGSLSPLGLQVAQRVFNHFDSNGDGALQLDELNAMTTFAGGQPLSSEAWGFIVELLGIQLTTPEGYIPRSEYPKLFRFQLGTDPVGCKQSLERLGIHLDASAYPPPPSPAELEALKQLAFQKKQQQVQDQMQMNQFMHSLRTRISDAVFAAPCRNCGYYRSSRTSCSRCGAV